MKKKEILPLKYEVAEDAITFTIGESSVRVSRDDFLNLIDGPGMVERFWEATPANAGFAALDNVETYAKVYRLLKKGLVLEQVAQLLGVPGETARRFWAYSLSRNPGKAEAAAEIKRQGADAEGKDYCKAVGFETEGPNAGQPHPPVFVDALGAKTNLTYFGAAGRAAEMMGLDCKDFELWVERNKRVLEVLG